MVILFTPKTVILNQGTLAFFGDMLAVELGRGNCWHLVSNVWDIINHSTTHRDSNHQ